MIITWKQFAREGGEYHLAKVESKNIGWCIRRIHGEWVYWLGALVRTSKDIPMRRPGAARGDIGPFDSLDAAKAAAEIMYQPKEK